MTALTPSSAVAVSPNAWQQKRAWDYDRARENAVLGIMRSLGFGNRTAPRTDESIRAVITRVVGETNAAKLKLDSLPKRGAHKGTLFLECVSSAHAFVLRPFLPALKQALIASGIKEVRLR